MNGHKQTQRINARGVRCASQLREKHPPKKVDASFGSGPIALLSGVILLVQSPLQKYSLKVGRS